MAFPEYRVPFCQKGNVQLHISSHNPQIQKLWKPSLSKTHWWQSWLEIMWRFVYHTEYEQTFHWRNISGWSHYAPQPPWGVLRHVRNGFPIICFIFKKSGFPKTSGFTRVLEKTLWTSNKTHLSWLWENWLRSRPGPWQMLAAIMAAVTMISS